MTKEERLLVLLAQQKISDADKDAIRSLAPDAAWAMVIKLASFHKIENFIYYNARTNALLDVIPPKAAAVLKTKYYQVSILNSKLKGVIENISSLCYKNRITLVKGSSLITDFYDDLGARYMGDVDIMVRKSDRDSVWKAMLHGGWNCDNWPGFKSKYHAELSDVEYKTMHYIYRETPSGRYFADIHWKFYCGEADDAVADLAFETDRKLDGNIYVHSNEMQLVHLCMNNYLDYTQNGVIFMRNLCDINEFLLNRSIRWNMVEQILKMQCVNTTMRSAVVLGLNCVNKLFCTTIPIQYQSTVFDGREVTPTMLTHCGTPMTKLTFRQSLQKKFKTLGSTPRVLGFIFKSIFPDRKWLRGAFHGSKSPLLSYWKYLIQRHITHSVSKFDY
ncbi:MAG: nucleotidyltransferase family protein [Paludibacteraceae bacterium]|nr:nucleotidyltransferase family protein [Paludibacteraceae bacterium]